MPSMMHNPYSEYTSPDTHSQCPTAPKSEVQIPFPSSISYSSSESWQSNAYTESQSLCSNGCQLVLVHDPYSEMAYKMVQRCTCSDLGEEDKALHDMLAASLKHKINLRCPNGHNCTKRLRFRKGQSHYSCVFCGIKWKE